MPRRSRRAGDESSDDEPSGRQRNDGLMNDDSDNRSEGGMEVDGQQSADDQLAKKLARYALSCEYSRTTIRRDGIKDRVLGNQARSFKRIFGMAQKQLRDVWGMELRELPVREKTTLQEKRQAMKSNSQPKIGSGNYILSSTLPDEYRSAAILRPSRIPSAEEEAIYVAFYTMVVSMISLSGGEMSEQKLKRQLGRMNADQNMYMEKTDVTLKRMERQGYVVRKLENPAVGQDGDQSVTWHVGPRAKEEIGLSGIMGFVKEVFGGADKDIETKLKASLGIREAPAQDEDADMG